MLNLWGDQPQILCENGKIVSKFLGYPDSVAGVPPDYFSAAGQKWNNPLYDWDAHKKEGYQWWIARIRNQIDQVDYLRSLAERLRSCSGHSVQGASS